MRTCWRPSLAGRAKEVTTIMMALFDQETVDRINARDQRKEGRQEAEQKYRLSYREMKAKGMSADEILKILFPGAETEAEGEPRT